VSRVCLARRNRHISAPSAGRSQGPQARASLGRGRQASVECSLRTPQGPKGRHLQKCVGPARLIVVESPTHRWLAPPAEVVPGLRPSGVSWPVSQACRVVRIPRGGRAGARFPPAADGWAAAHGVLRPTRLARSVRPAMIQTYNLRRRRPAVGACMPERGVDSNRCGNAAYNVPPEPADLATISTDYTIYHGLSPIL
jgi:hypothetical protein